MADFAIWLRDKKGFAIKTWMPCYSNYEAGQQVNNFLLERMGKAGFQAVGEAALDTKGAGPDLRHDPHPFQARSGARPCHAARRPAAASGALQSELPRSASSPAAPAAIPISRCGATFRPTSPRRC